MEKSTCGRGRGCWRIILRGLGKKVDASGSGLCSEVGFGSGPGTADLVSIKRQEFLFIWGGFKLTCTAELQIQLYRSGGGVPPVCPYTYCGVMIRRDAVCVYVPRTLSPPNRFPSSNDPFPTVKTIFRELNFTNFDPFFSSTSPFTITWAVQSATQQDV